MYAIQEDSKIELLQRREIAMRPTSIKHILIQRNLSGILWQFLRGKKCQVLTASEFVFDEENKFIPDLIVVCEPDKIKKTISRVPQTSLLKSYPPAPAAVM